LLHGAISADVAEVDGLVELPLVVAPAPVVVLVEPVAAPLPARADPVVLDVVPVPVVVEPVVPTAVEPVDVRPVRSAVVPAPRVLSPARAVVLGA
jgi:hypothetical protein